MFMYNESHQLFLCDFFDHFQLFPCFVKTVLNLFGDRFYYVSVIQAFFFFFLISFFKENSVECNIEASRF